MIHPIWSKLVINLKKEFPKFKIVEKETSKLMKFLYTVLLMKYWNKIFITHFTTVVYQTVYMPKDCIGTIQGYTILRHEAVHMRDSKSWRAFHFYLSYLLLLPAGLCMRAYWEYRAYTESMKVEYELNKNISDSYIDFLAKQFTSSSYLWMFPFSKTIRNLLIKQKDKIIKGS